MQNGDEFDGSGVDIYGGKKAPRNSWCFGQPKECDHIWESKLQPGECIYGMKDPVICRRCGTIKDAYRDWPKVHRDGRLTTDDYWDIYQQTGRFEDMSRWLKHRAYEKLMNGKEWYECLSDEAKEEFKKMVF